VRDALRGMARAMARAIRRATGRASNRATDTATTFYVHRVTDTLWMITSSPACRENAAFEVRAHSFSEARDRALAELRRRRDPANTPGGTTQEDTT
jgi:hypothetical protein